MRHLIKFTLNAVILLILSFYEIYYSQTEAKTKTQGLVEQIVLAKPEKLESSKIKKDVTLRKLSKQIERSLNSKNISSLNEFIDKEISLDIQKKYATFTKSFPNAKWVIEPDITFKDNIPSLTLSVTAKKKKNSQLHSLEAKQKIALEIKGDKIVNYEIISEYSILRKTNKPISITLKIQS